MRAHRRKENIPSRAGAAETPLRRRFLERYNGLKLGWFHDSIHFILLVPAVFGLFRYVLGFAVVGGESMFPTLTDGEIVLYVRVVGEYRPGDVVSMRVPSGEYYVKRVAAVGGDAVELRDGAVNVNGEPIEDSLARGETLAEPGAVIYPYTVRDGSAFRGPV